MTKILVAAALAAAAVSLSACASMSSNQSDVLKQLDTNFAGCDRHITFQAGVGIVTPGAQVSGSVDCKGAGTATPAAAAAATTSPTP